MESGVFSSSERSELLLRSAAGGRAGLLTDPLGEDGSSRTTGMEAGIEAAVELEETAAEEEVVGAEDEAEADAEAWFLSDLEERDLMRFRKPPFFFFSPSCESELLREGRLREMEELQLDAQLRAVQILCTQAKPLFNQNKSNRQKFFQRQMLSGMKQKPNRR